MKRVALAAGVAALTWMAGPALAQSGEAGSVGFTAVPKATPEQVDAARQARSEAGMQAARQAVRGEAGAADTSVTLKVTPAERRAAADKRRAELADAQRSGELHNGEASN
jgi:hypothetical protein